MSLVGGPGVQAQASGEVCYLDGTTLITCPPIWREKTYQTAVSAQALVGLLMAGGSPLTSPRSEGFRLDFLPDVSAGLRWNVVSARLPDLTLMSGREDDPPMDGYLPSLNGEIALALTDGYTVRPGIGGIGAISVVGSFSYLPLSLFDAEAFDDASHGFGVGARLQLLGESFNVPGVSVSVSRTTVDEVNVGTICRQPSAAPPPEAGKTSVEYCDVAETLHWGEASFDLTAWSSRVGIGKNLGRLGLVGGVGHDWYNSNTRHAEITSTGETSNRYTLVGPLETSSRRLTIFGGISYPLLVGSASLEGGWQQGAPAVRDSWPRSPGVVDTNPVESSYDPRKGTWYGSLSARIAL